MSIRSPLLISLLAGLAVVVAAEGLVRSLVPFLPRPISWYSQEAQVKADDIAAMARAGVSPDVLFIGSSTVRAAFDPQVFVEQAGCPIVAYNAGLTGLRPRALEHWVGWTLARIAPRQVVIGITTAELRAEGSDAFWGRYSAAAAAREDLGTRLTRRIETQSTLLRYRGVLRNPIYLRPAVDQLMGRPAFMPWENFTAGYRPPGSQAFTMGQFDLREATISEREIAARVRAMEIIGNSGAHLVVVNMPVPPEYTVRHVGGAAGYRAIVAASMDRARELGAEVIDLGAMGDARLFEDPLHVNNEGSRMATILVAAQLDLCGKAR